MRIYPIIMLNALLPQLFQQLVHAFVKDQDQLFRHLIKFIALSHHKEVKYFIPWGIMFPLEFFLSCQCSDHSLYIIFSWLNKFLRRQVLKLARYIIQQAEKSFPKTNMKNCFKHESLSVREYFFEVSKRRSLKTEHFDYWKLFLLSKTISSQIRVQEHTITLLNDCWVEIDFVLLIERCWNSNPILLILLAKL